MEREGAWALFWRTGLPEAWLATRPQTEETAQPAAACAAPPAEADGL